MKNQNFEYVIENGLYNNESVGVKLQLSNKDQNQYEIISLKEYMKKYFITEDIDTINLLIEEDQTPLLEYIPAAEIEYYYNINDLLNTSEITNKIFNQLIMQEVENITENLYYIFHHNQLDQITTDDPIYFTEIKPTYTKEILTVLLTEYYGLQSNNTLKELSEEFQQEITGDRNFLIIEWYDTEKQQYNLTNNLIIILSDIDYINHYTAKVITNEILQDYEQTITDQIHNNINTTLTYYQTIHKTPTTKLKKHIEMII